MLKFTEQVLVIAMTNKIIYHIHVHKYFSD